MASRAGLSNTTQLAEITDIFVNTMNVKGEIDVVFIDFSSLLLNNQTESCWYWTQHCSLDNMLVNFQENNVWMLIAASLTLWMCTREPLRGLCLGPCWPWFIKMIFAVQAPIMIRLFADECVVCANINKPDNQMILSYALHSICTRCNKCGLKPNISKTASITFTNKRESFQFVYTVNNANVQWTEQVKYLGITPTSNLSWELHIDNLCSNTLTSWLF